MRAIVSLFVVLLFSTPVWSASFINGGFEDGTFNGWTKDGGVYYGDYVYDPYDGLHHYTGDPGKSAIVGTGMDYYSGNNLNMVYNGDYAARINNYDDYFHFSTISQTVNNWTDDHIYFEWAAVLQNPGHSYAGHFSLELTNESTGTSLYSKSFDYYTAAGEVEGGWLDGVYGWKYSNWQIVDLDVSAYLGDDIS